MVAQAWRGLRVLVAMVSDSGSQSQARVESGMSHIDATFHAHHALVDWVICAYDDGADAWQRLQGRSAAALSHTRLIAVVNASTSDSIAVMLR